MIVLVSAADARQQAHLVAALGGWAKAVVPEVSGPEAAAAAYSSSGCVAGIVVIDRADGRGALFTLRALKASWPALPLIVCAELRALDTQLSVLLEAGRAGATDAVALPTTSEVLRTVLARHAPTVGARRVLRDVVARLGPLTQRIVTCCLADPVHVHSVAAVAERLGVHRRTLVNWCESEAMPEPKVLVAWARALVAIHVLEQTARSFERVALDLGYESAAALRAVLRRCGACTADVRYPGAFRAGVDRFRIRVLAAPSGDGGCGAGRGRPAGRLPEG